MIRIGFFGGDRADSHERYSVRYHEILLVWTILAFIILFALYIGWGASPDPRFSLAHLNGMTPEQVIAQLGPPRIDLRLPKFEGWTPAMQESVGPLKFYYYDEYRWRGFEYCIIFHDNHVSDARFGTK